MIAHKRDSRKVDFNLLKGQQIVFGYEQRWGFRFDLQRWVVGGPAVWRRLRGNLRRRVLRRWVLQRGDLLTVSSSLYGGVRGIKLRSSQSRCRLRGKCLIGLVCFGAESSVVR